VARRGLLPGLLFDGQQDILKVMEGAGAQGEPQVKFMRVLETGDAF
jgi:hypothetical protein